MQNNPLWPRIFSRVSTQNPGMFILASNGIDRQANLPHCREKILKGIMSKRQRQSGNVYLHARFHVYTFSAIFIEVVRSSVVVVV